MTKKERLKVLLDSEPQKKDGLEVIQMIPSKGYMTFSDYRYKVGHYIWKELKDISNLKDIDLDLKRKAIKHKQMMSEKYGFFTIDSSNGSFGCRRSANYRTKTDTIPFIERQGIITEISFIQDSLVNALFKYNDNINTCVLSPSTFHIIGGGFMHGYDTEEARLCHASNLYNLQRQKDFVIQYRTNREKDEYNGGRCSDWMMLFRKVLFINKKGDMDRVHVASVAPPFYKRLYDSGISNHELRDIIEKRLDYCFTILEKVEITTLIISDWGCEYMFSIPPILIAECMKKQLYGRQIDRVIFAIENRENLRIFKYVFECEEVEIDYNNPLLVYRKRKGR